MNEPVDETPNFRSNSPVPLQVRKFFSQTGTLQGLATIRMRRPALDIIPRRVAAVAQNFLGLVPRPKFRQAMRPQGQVKRAHIGPDVSHLLLARSFDFFQIVMILL